MHILRLTTRLHGDNNSSNFPFTNTICPLHAHCRHRLYIRIWIELGACWSLCFCSELFSNANVLLDIKENQALCGLLHTRGSWHIRRWRRKMCVDKKHSKMRLCYYWIIKVITVKKARIIIGGIAISGILAFLLSWPSRLPKYPSAPPIPDNIYDKEILTIQNPPIDYLLRFQKKMEC